MDIDDEFSEMTPMNILESKGKIQRITKSRTVTIYYNYKILPVNFLVVDPERVRKYCIGCPAYGKKWSCPPDCDIIPDHYKRIFLFWLWIDAKDFGGVKNKEYIKVRAMNAILVSLSNQIGRVMTIMLVGHLLASGSCKVCKKCSYPEKCHLPDRFYQSLESTGIDLVRTMRKLNFELCWYGKRKKEQNYTHGTVIGGILTNLDEGSEYFDKLIKSFDIKPKEKSLDAWA